MSMNFPNNPSNGDTYSAGGVTYVYDSTIGVWKRQGSSGGFDPASVSESLIPDTNETYDLGSNTNKFRDLYLSGNSITLGSVELSDNNGSLEVTPVSGGGAAEAFATEAYVTTQVNNLVDAAPGALDTLNELAAALGDDANFSTTITNSLATKADTSSLATVATSGDYNDLTNLPSTSSYSNSDVETYLESNATADRIQLRTNNAYFGVGTATGSAGMAIKNNGGQPFFYGQKYLPANNGQTDLELEANSGGKINVNNFRIYNVATPTDTTDAATKAYVDTEISNLATVATSGDYNDLTNTPAGGGNVVEYTSTSSASVNDVVMLNTNGTVTPVEPTNYPVNTQIALSTIGSAHGDNSPHNGLGMIAHKPTDRNSGMVVYRDKNNENHTISSFAASGGSFSISATATVSNTSQNMKLYPFFDPFDDTKVLLLYTRSSNARCKIVDTAANGSISINSEIDLGQLGSTSNKHFEVDMVNSTSGDVKIICSVPGYVTQLTWDGTNITAGTPIATTNNGYHRFSLGQDGLFAMVSGTSLRAGKVDWTAGTVTEGASLTVTDNGDQAYAVSESGKIAYAFYDGNATKISTFSINSSTYACTLLHTSAAIDNRYNSGTPRPHDIMFAPGGESFGYSWYGSDNQNASSSDNKAILGTVASNGTITFISTPNSNAGQMYSFLPAGVAATQFRFLAASDWSNSMAQKGLVGFYSLKFNNYNPISQLRLLDLPYSESNLDVSKIHGLAASSGTTIDVTLENGIHTGLSGLTVGSKYYVLENGTLSTSPDSNNAKVGLAITSTSLALDFADELTSADLGTYATKAYVASQVPSLTGYATETYVDTSVANLVDSAPATLDTLNELAAALGDDANFATTITNQIAAKADPYSTAPVTVSGGKYYIDGEQQVILTLQPGRTYRFDQSDASNNSHPLRFSEIEDGTHAGGGATEYTTGVTINGTAGNTGAYVEIEVTHATPRLYYYCGNHTGMGGKVSVGKEMFVERITSDTWITGPIQTTSVNVGTGGQINASTATLDFTHTTVNFSGATVGGLSNSDVDLANIVDNAQGVVVTGKVAADSLDIGTGGQINASTSTLDFTHTLVNFSGATVGGLSDTIQDEVDFHLNKSNSSGQTIISDGQVLSWNATGGLQGTGDYEWVAQSGGGGGSASIEISETAPSSPTAGTMWFDSSVGKTFIYYNDGNTSQWVQMNPSSSGTLTVGSSAPTSPSTGEQWYNTNDGALYIYYNDGDSSQWVGVSGPAGPAGADGAVTIGDNPPSSPTVGQQWFDSSDGSLYIYYNDGTSNQWVATSGPASVTSTPTSWTEKTANYTVVAGEKLLVDCSGGAKTITLPVSANMGDEIRIIDATGNASTNNITVARNGHKIQGGTQDLTIDTDRAAFGLVYYNSTQGWLLTER